MLSILSGLDGSAAMVMIGSGVWNLRQDKRGRYARISGLEVARIDDLARTGQMNCKIAWVNGLETNVRMISAAETAQRTRVIMTSATGPRQS